MNTLRVLILIVSTLCLASGCAFDAGRAQADAMVAQAASNYRSDDGRFTVSIPTGWKVVRDLPDTIITLMPEQTPPGTIVMVSFGRQRRSADLPATLLGFEREAFHQANGMMGPVSVLSATDAKLSGFPARRVEYSARRSGLDTHEVQVFAFDRQDVVTANYCATSDFGRFREAADRIIASAWYANAE